jgi:hypothetical protein
MTGIMGIAVISGIIKGLSSQRGVTQKEEGEKAMEEAEPSAKKADL